MVSFGGPVRRNASPRSPSPLMPRGSSRRVMVSGLYWKTTILASGLKASMPTRAPLRRRGEPGKVLMRDAYRLFWALRRILGEARVGVGVVDRVGRRQRGVL